MNDEETLGKSSLDFHQVQPLLPRPAFHRDVHTAVKTSSLAVYVQLILYVMQCLAQDPHIRELNKELK